MNVATLDIHDWNEFSNTVKPSSAGTLSHVRPKLPRGSHFPAAFGVHRHTSTRILHGRREQSGYLGLRNTSDRFLCRILRIHVPTLHSLGEINSKSASAILFLSFGNTAELRLGLYSLYEN